LKTFDIEAKKAVDAAPKGNPEATAALGVVRKHFNAASYDTSLVARVRNVDPET